MSEPHTNEEQTPKKGPEVVVAELVTKSTAKSKEPPKARSLAGLAFRGLGTKTQEKREEENQRERELEDRSTRKKEDLLAEFKGAFKSDDDIDVEPGAWKHAEGGAEEDKVTVQLIKKLQLDDDDAVKKWLSRQDWEDFALTERNTVLINFSVYLDSTSKQTMAGVMRRRPRKDEANIVVKHIGPASRY